MKDEYIILLVTYNRAFRLHTVVSALLNQAVPARKIIIVDNNSDDHTRAVLSEFKGDSIVYLNTGDNIGHGAGIAYGLSWYMANDYRDEWLMFAEDDSESTLDWAKSMIERIASSDYGMLVLDGQVHRLGSRRSPKKDGVLPVDVDFGLLDGAIARSGLFKVVGVPVTDWFMMCDDLEYCTRIKKMGFKIGCVPNHYVSILHLGGSGISKSTSMWRAYYQSRNHVHFVRIHLSAYRLLDFLIMELKRILAALLVERNLKKVVFRIKGIWHGVMGVKGRNLDPKTLSFC